VLWGKLRRRPGQMDVRDALFERYFPMVEKTAEMMRRKLPENVEVDDLVSVGAQGLLEAISRFDATRGLKFNTFALYRIRGAMVDELRETDPEARSTRLAQRQREAAKAHWAHTFGRQPNNEELRVALGWTVQELEASRPKQVEDLQPYQDDSLEEAGVPARPDCEALQEQSAASIAEATRGLTFESRVIVYLLFAKGKTLRHIGEVMDLSESRCSQLKTAAMEWLRQNRQRGKLVELMS
ncbi:MAG: sigma-70 family RNA polymerase sigma factor, partial [Acidimicrobiia bacterium]